MNDCSQFHGLFRAPCRNKNALRGTPEILSVKGSHAEKHGYGRNSLGMQPSSIFGTVPIFSWVKNFVNFVFSSVFMNLLRYLCWFYTCIVCLAYLVSFIDEIRTFCVEIMVLKLFVRLLSFILLKQRCIDRIVLFNQSSLVQTSLPSVFSRLATRLSLVATRRAAGGHAPAKAPAHWQPQTTAGFVRVGWALTLLPCHVHDKWRFTIKVRVETKGNFILKNFKE